MGEILYIPTSDESQFRQSRLETVPKLVVDFSLVCPHYLFTPTLTLPLKGEGTFEIVS